MPEFRDRLRRGLGLVDQLIHPSVAHDASGLSRHRAFIGAHLACGALALAALPMLLALHGPLSPTAILVFAWALTQLPLAMYVSRSGALAHGQLGSALASAGFVAGLAALSGGLGSPALPFLVLAPLEAALTCRRGAVALTLATCLALVALLAGVDARALAPVDAEPVFGILSIGAVATAMALMLASLLALAFVAEFRAAHADMQGEAERHRLLALHARDAVAVHEPGGRIASISPTVRGLFGLAPGELAGDGFFQRLHVGDRPAYLKAVSDTAADGTSHRLELRLRRGGNRPGETGLSDFGWIGFETMIDPESGRVVSVIRDIDTRREMEADRDAAREAADAAQEARSRFLATVSHELRTPLNAILGFSDLMRKLPQTASDTQKVRDYAGLIHESGSHLLQLVNDMLNMARIEAGQFRITSEPVDMRNCLDGCRRMMAAEADQAGLRLSSDIPLDLGEFTADPRACRQIALNLLANAVKFTAAGGRVVLFARKEASGLVFGVRDTGVGIAADDLLRVTKPFVQASDGTTRAHEGAGLGLSVVKGLAELHGGRISLESRVGHGTCVTVYLPAGHTQAASPAACIGPDHEAEPGPGVTGMPAGTDDAALRRIA
ncbi:multi-sensor signal transduction histidine kinase [Stappia sp. ES.058]|nr:multi-sensor signal transduction histidine kinase [Stappia sp. ES.058]